MSESTKERLVVACFILMIVAAVGCVIAVVLAKLFRQLLSLGHRAAVHDSIIAAK